MWLIPTEWMSIMYLIINISCCGGTGECSIYKFTYLRNFCVRLIFETFKFQFYSAPQIARNWFLFARVFVEIWITAIHKCHLDHFPIYLQRCRFLSATVLTSFHRFHIYLLPLEIVSYNIQCDGCTICHWANIDRVMMLHPVIRWFFIVSTLMGNY